MSEKRRGIRMNLFFFDEIIIMTILIDITFVMEEMVCFG